MGNQLHIGRSPVEPARFVILRIGIVVASLAAAELIARRQHHRSAREEQCRQKCLHIAAGPGRLMAIAVAVGLAIGMVVLDAKGHRIA